MSKRYTSLTDIPTELISIWNSVIEQGELTLPFETGREAHSMQCRLYEVRKTLTANMYPNSNQMTRFEISRKDNTLYIRLPGWLRSVRKALEETGVEVPPAGGELDATFENKQGPIQENSETEKVSKLSDTISKLYGPEKSEDRNGEGKDK